MGFDATPRTPEEIGAELRELRAAREMFAAAAERLAKLPPSRGTASARTKADEGRMWIKDREREAGGELMALNQHDFAEDKD